jgi:hypothetical protein
LGLVSYSLHGRLQSEWVSGLTLPERWSLSTSPWNLAPHPADRILANGATEQGGQRPVDLARAIGASGPNAVPPLRKLPWRRKWIWSERRSKRATGTGAATGAAASTGAGVSTGTGAATGAAASTGAGVSTGTGAATGTAATGAAAGDNAIRNAPPRARSRAISF